MASGREYPEDFIEVADMAIHDPNLVEMRWGAAGGMSAGTALASGKCEIGIGLSPVSHPGMSRVGWPFEPAWLDTATGRGAEPPIASSVPSRCDGGTLSLA
jgi:hypothetical protein